MVCKILVPWPGIKSVPPAVESLNHGPPGKSLHMNFKITLSNSAKKKPAETFIGIMLNVQIGLGRMDILIILSFLTHEQGVSFHLIWSSFSNIGVRVFLSDTFLIHISRCYYAEILKISMSNCSLLYTVGIYNCFVYIDLVSCNLGNY